MRQTHSTNPNQNGAAKMRKILGICAAVGLAFFATKEIVATRAHEFIVSCTTDEEREFVLHAADDENQKEKIEIAAKTIECVKNKQNMFEQIFSALMGKNLFK